MMHRLISPRAVVTLILVGVLALTALAGCGETSPETAAAGTYTLDAEAMRAAVEAQIAADVPENMRAEFQMVFEMISAFDMTVTLNEDGTAVASMSMMGDEDSATGTWSINENDRVTISIKRADTGDEAPATGVLEGDTIRLTLPDEGATEIILVRVQE